MTTVDDSLLRRIAGEADLAEVRLWLENLTDKQEDCRFELGHSWQRYDAFTTNIGYVRIARCSRCGGRRKRTYVRGRIVSADYQHKAGFAAPKGIGHLTADDIAALREILFQREMAEKAEKEAANAATKGNSRRRKVAA